jgi:hypothetical protein
MNFITKFVAGQSGLNKGLTMGIPSLDKALGGIRKYHSYGIAAAPKCGKTTLVDFCFIISPYLQALRDNTLDKLDIIDFSFEIDRISKEFKFAAFFFFYDFGISTYTFQDEIYDIDQDYLMGAKTYVAGKTDKGEDIREVIPITPEHKDILKNIYYTRIIPIFGEYDANGNQIKPGKVLVIEEQDNPTGMYKYLLNYARKHGTFKMEKYTISDERGRTESKERIIGFQDNTPDVYRIIITDHIRKLILERGFTMKQNIDKWLEYTTILRNRCGYIFANICHSNRGIANTQRLQHAGEMIFPTSDDVKDTGNLAEESTVLMTLFNAGDEKYNLTRHMGVELVQYPKYRSLHITESRYTECPIHIQLNMYGNINYFAPLFAQF